METNLTSNAIRSRTYSWRVLRHCVGLALLVTLMAGCENALPRAKEVTQSPWDNFDAAKAAYDQIAPGQTTVSELRALGFDPLTTPNIAILSYLDVIMRFMPNDSIGLDDLDPAVRACIESRSACHGYHVHPQQVRGKRIGNVFADVFNFRRHTVRSGWSFSAILLLKDERVMYKIWSGQPSIRSEEDNRNPLGPLQNAEGVARAIVVP